jgi:hypothetical protein
VPKGKAALEARNRLIHTHGVVDAAGVTGSIVVKGTMKLESRSEGELLGDVARLAEAVESGSVLLGHWPPREAGEECP